MADDFRSSQYGAALVLKSGLKDVRAWRMISRKAQTFQGKIVRRNKEIEGMGAST
jgi:hypothetical protein